MERGILRGTLQSRDGPLARRGGGSNSSPAPAGTNYSGGPGISLRLPVVRRPREPRPALASRPRFLPLEGTTAPRSYHPGHAATAPHRDTHTPGGASPQQPGAPGADGQQPQATADGATPATRPRSRRPQPTQPAAAATTAAAADSTATPSDPQLRLRLTTTAPQPPHQPPTFRGMGRPTGHGSALRVDPPAMGKPRHPQRSSHSHTTRHPSKPPSQGLPGPTGATQGAATGGNTKQTPAAKGGDQRQPESPPGTRAIPGMTMREHYLWVTTGEIAQSYVDRELAPGGDADTYQGGTSPATHATQQQQTGGMLVITTGGPAPPAPGGDHPEQGLPLGNTKGGEQTGPEIRGSSTALNCSSGGTTSCTPGGGDQHPSQPTRHTTPKQPARGTHSPRQPGPPRQAAAERQTLQTSSTDTTCPGGPTLPQSPPSQQQTRSHHSPPRHRPTTHTGTPANHSGSVEPQQQKHAAQQQGGGPGAQARAWQQQRPSTTRTAPPDSAGGQPGTTPTKGPSSSHTTSRDRAGTEHRRHATSQARKQQTTRCRRRSQHTPNQGRTPGGNPAPKQPRHTTKTANPPTLTPRSHPQPHPASRPPASVPRRGRQRTNSAAGNPHTKGGRENTRSAKQQLPTKTGGDLPSRAKQRQRKGGLADGTTVETATRGHKQTSKRQRRRSQLGTRGGQQQGTQRHSSTDDTRPRQHWQSTTWHHGSSSSYQGGGGTQPHTHHQASSEQPNTDSWWHHSWHDSNGNPNTHKRGTPRRRSRATAATPSTHKRGTPRRHSRAVAATCPPEGGKDRSTRTRSGTDALCVSAPGLGRTPIRAPLPG